MKLAIQLALVVCVGAVVTSSFAFFTDQTVDASYEALEEVSKKQVIVDDYLITIPTLYSMVASKLGRSSDIFQLEPTAVRLQNRCSRDLVALAIHKSAELLYGEAGTISSETLQTEFEIEERHSKLKKIMAEYRGSTPADCTNNDFAGSVRLAAEDLLRDQLRVIDFLKRVRSELNQESQRHYEIIEIQSTQAASFYLWSFGAQLLAAFLVILLDLRSNSRSRS